MLETLAEHWHLCLLMAFPLALFAMTLRIRPLSRVQHVLSSEPNRKLAKPVKPG